MSTGLYTHTTRSTGTVLTAAIYNGDHVNHITNQNPLMTGAYSDNVSQMQTNTDPGAVGTESLAGSLGGELERLRFVIKQMNGGAQWYPALLNTQGANIASAGTINLDTATGDYVHITGTTTITAITLAQGREKTVVFDGILTLTNGASLILIGGANIATTAGYAVKFRGEAAGVVRQISQNTVATFPVVDVQTFTAGGTWTKPAGAKTVFALCVGAGGGGGGGGGSSAGTVRQGGTGGGGGSCVSGTFNAADLGATETVTVGTAGTSGAAASDGGTGGTSSLGTKLLAYGGGGGNGTGGGSTRTGGSGGGTAGAGVVGGIANITGGLPALTSNAVGVSGQGAGCGLAQAGKPAEYGGASGGGEDSAGTSALSGGGSMWGGAAGGCGGSVSAANVELAGAAGGAAGTYVVGTGVAGGAVNGGAGNAGANGAGLVMGGGGSGGGGQDSGTGGAGGAGGAPGGGGGGGGGGTTTGGAGGAGGRGEVRVYTYF